MKVRESNIELLRIIAACSVVFSHMSPIIQKALLLESGGGIFTLTGGAVSWNYIISQLFLSFSVCAVNVFILITGYFSCHSQNRNIGKPLNLVLLMIVVDIASYLLQIIAGAQQFTTDGLLLHAFPTNYFVTLFIVLYIISPYINLCLNKLSEKGQIRMIAILFLVFSVYPSIIDIIEEAIGKHIIGISPIGRLGSQNGYNIVNFVLVYCLGAMINTEIVKDFVAKHKRLPLVAAVVCVLSIFIWNQFSHSAVNYHNPFVIVLAVSMVLTFMQMHFTSKVVNELAKAAFTAFLLHVHFIHYIHIDYFCHQSPFIFVLFILASITVIYLVSWVAWRIYDMVTKPVFKRLNVIQIPYNIYIYD